MMSQFRFCIFVCMSFCVSATSTIASENTDSYNQVLVSDDGWFFVRALGCLLPIPNKYILMSDGSPFTFYEADKNKLQQGAGRIKIQNYDAKYQLKFEELDITLINNENGYMYEHVRRDDKHLAYMIRKDSQVVLISHINHEKQKNLSKSMFEYCIAHQ